MNEQVFKQMLEVYSYQLDIARESEERVKALRHDIKHHIIELSAMAKKNNNDDMIKYLSGMKEFMLNPKEYSTTGNQEIDGVLNYMLQKANKTLNQVDVQINIPEDLYFNNFNICVILGNLVDNAVREASKSKEKLLTIKMYDDCGREIGWGDYTNHGYGDINSPHYHTTPHWHEKIYNAQYPDGIKINHRTDVNTPLGDK